MEQRADWYHIGFLADGSVYVRWSGVGEFLVESAGEKIFYASDPVAHAESFHVYLLAQALSFALIKRGFEPLHATVVEIDGAAIAFIGPSGFGKSTLAASFLADGCRLVTDDLLIVRAGESGPEVHSGPQRIKLFADVAPLMLGGAAGNLMNPDSDKFVFPLSPQTEESATEQPLPLRAIYQLNGPATKPVENVAIERLAPREAFHQLIGNTFNRQLVDRARLQRQAIAARDLVVTVGVSKLSYPRDIERLGEVRQAIRDDLSRRSNQNAVEFQ